QYRPRRLSEQLQRRQSADVHHIADQCRNIPSAGRRCQRRRGLFRLPRYIVSRVLYTKWRLRAIHFLSNPEGSQMKVPKRLQGRVSERGMAVIAAAVILVISVPMIGLAIDASVLFATKSRLQAAVDGAALAGTRGLARGTNSGAQIAAAQTAA